MENLIPAILESIKPYFPTALMILGAFGLWAWYKGFLKFRWIRKESEEFKDRRKDDEMHKSYIDALRENTKVMQEVVDVQKSIVEELKEHTSIFERVLERQIKMDVKIDVIAARAAA